MFFSPFWVLPSYQDASRHVFHDIFSFASQNEPFVLLLCICLNNTHRLSFQSNNSSLVRREGDVTQQCASCGCQELNWRRRMHLFWSSPMPVNPLSLTCLWIAMMWSESCFSSEVDGERCLVRLILRFTFGLISGTTEFGHHDEAWQTNNWRDVKTKSFHRSENDWNWSKICL